MRLYTKLFRENTLSRTRRRSNAKSKKSKHATRAAVSQFRFRLREGLLILTVALSAFLLTALLSYHRADPGWSHAVTNSRYIIQNDTGVVGAYFADLFLYLFGYLAYLFPIMSCYAAWLSYKNRYHRIETRSLRWSMVLVRLAGFMMIIAAGGGLAQLHLDAVTAQLPFHAGGIIGMVVSGLMLQAFNSVGTTLVETAVLLIGVTLFTGLSWTLLLEQIGAGVWKLAGLLNTTFKNITWSNLLNFKQWFNHENTKKRVIERVEPRVIADKATKKSRFSFKKSKKDEMDKGPDENDVDKAMQRAPRYSQSKVLPKLSLLDDIKHNNKQVSKAELEQCSDEVESHLADFGIEAKVVAVHPGPVVTRFELQLAAGTKASKITGLAKDLARSLSVSRVRVVEVIPGKSYVGIELPNEQREMVGLKEVLSSKQYQRAHSPLTLALGKDIAGHPVIADLAKMPHLLVAGTTGSGKSVTLNAMLLSLIYKSTPQQLRLILIDPKMLELSVYDGIPHLLTPVVTDMRDAATALRWCVVEMERRYRLMASLGVRNIAGYNEKVREAAKQGSPLLDPLAPKSPEGEPPAELQELPQIVVLADEFADMMVVVGKKVETLIARLAQKARAAGVHLIFATQRPSVDVITGLIKANIPTRIAFQVSSKVDSRTILDQQGAEQLLGNGDMLYLPPGTGVPVRVHGSFVSDEEVHRVVSYLKAKGEANYVEDVLDVNSGTDLSGYTEAAMGETDAEQDELYDAAVAFVVQSRRVSISSIQRRFKIGYNRSARIVEAMEKAGVVSPMEGNGSREVLAPSTVQED